MCKIGSPIHLSLHRREGFVRRYSVIGGEREVFVILTIPVRLGETDFKIMCDRFGGEIQHTI